MYIFKGRGTGSSIDRDPPPPSGTEHTKGYPQANFFYFLPYPTCIYAVMKLWKIGSDIIVYLWGIVYVCIYIHLSL